LTKWGRSGPWLGASARVETRKGERFVAVLEIPPVESAQRAVNVPIGAEPKKRRSDT